MTMTLDVQPYHAGTPSWRSRGGDMEIPWSLEDHRDIRQAKAALVFLERMAAGEISFCPPWTPVETRRAVRVARRRLRRAETLYGRLRR